MFNKSVEDNLTDCITYLSVKFLKLIAINPLAGESIWNNIVEGGCATLHPPYIEDVSPAISLKALLVYIRLYVSSKNLFMCFITVSLVIGSRFSCALEIFGQVGMNSAPTARSGCHFHMVISTASNTAVACSNSAASWVLHVPAR